MYESILAIRFLLLEQLNKNINNACICLISQAAHSINLTCNFLNQIFKKRFRQAWSSVVVDSDTKIVLFYVVNQLKSLIGKAC